MNEIAVLLQTVSENRSENILTIDQVRNWLAKYLRMHDEEITRFPEEKDLPHWDLLAADYDTAKDAMFLLAFFKNDSVTFLAGRGSVSSVRDFGQNSFPENADKVLDDLSDRFWIAGRATVNRDDLVHWLNR
jgi:hypothetical protein